MEIKQYLPFLIVLNSFSSEVDLDLFLKIQKNINFSTSTRRHHKNLIIADHRYTAFFRHFSHQQLMLYLKQEVKMPEDQQHIKEKKEM